MFTCTFQQPFWKQKHFNFLVLSHSLRKLHSVAAVSISALIWTIPASQLSGLPHLWICLCNMNKPWNWNLLTGRVLAPQVYHWSKCMICNRFLSELFLLHKHQVLCSHTIKFYLWLESSEVITTNTLREVKWLPQRHQLFGDKEGNRNCLSQIYIRYIFIILSYLL